MAGKNKSCSFYWHHSAAGTVITFNKTPFQIGYKRDLECQYGKHYYKKKDGSSKSNEEGKKKLPRVRTQGTRKQGCKAHIHIREYILYPEYSIEDEVACRLSKWKLRQLKEEKLKLLNKRTVVVTFDIFVCTFTVYIIIISLHHVTFWGCDRMRMDRCESSPSPTDAHTDNCKISIMILKHQAANQTSYIEYGR